MSDGPKPPFYALNAPPARPGQPQPGERLFEFVVGHDRYAFELRDHGEIDVECQIFKPAFVSSSRAAPLSAPLCTAPACRPSGDR
jgi:hypothetical protein